MKHEVQFSEGEIRKARAVFDIMAKREGLIDSSPLSDEIMIRVMFTYGVDAMVTENNRAIAEADAQLAEVVENE